MQVFVTLVLAFFVALVLFKLVGLLVRFVFSTLFGILKLAFVVACVLSVVYFAANFLPLL